MDEDYKLAFTTVTYNNRPSLIKVVRQLLCQTVFKQPITWFMALQNCTDKFEQEILAVFQELQPKGVTLVICRFQRNLGLSKAMSYLIERTKRFEFTLNIEDDWILLDSHVLSPHWLAANLQFLETHTDVSAVFLRAYVGQKDKKQYGWTRTIPYRCHQFTDNFNYEEKMQQEIEIVKETQADGIENKFQLIPGFLFTFNPMLVRNHDFHRHVYPLPQFTNDQKDPQFQANWGCCEALVMERTRKAGLRTFWFNQGIFGHDEDFFPST